jgi:hypothetical protein
MNPFQNGPYRELAVGKNCVMVHDSLKDLIPDLDGHTAAAIRDIWFRLLRDNKVEQLDLGIASPAIALYCKRMLRGIGEFRGKRISFLSVERRSDGRRELSVKELDGKENPPDSSESGGPSL